jgi:ribosomal-protein-alanine N-acetyltransferase
MIRRAFYYDAEAINRIGRELHDNFDYLYNMEDTLNTTYSRVYVYEDNKEIVGFIHLDSHFEIMDLVNIIVKRDYQNKGIGTELLQYVIDNEEYNKIMLEVRESNSRAIHVYEKLGFKEIYRRKNYYQTEDAIIMERVRDNAK